MYVIGSESAHWIRQRWRVMKKCLICCCVVGRIQHSGVETIPRCSLRPLPAATDTYSKRHIEPRANLVFNGLLGIETPLAVAVASSIPRDCSFSIRYLLSRGADPNQRTAVGSLVE